MPGAADGHRSQRANPSDIIAGAIRWLSWPAAAAAEYGARVPRGHLTFRVRPMVRPSVASTSWSASHVSELLPASRACDTIGFVDPSGGCADMLCWQCTLRRGAPGPRARSVAGEVAPRHSIPTPCWSRYSRPCSRSTASRSVGGCYAGETVRVNGSRRRGIGLICHAVVPKGEIYREHWPLLNSGRSGIARCADDCMQLCCLNAGPRAARINRPPVRRP